ncbi:hypothetical protein [Neisseria meningitidis]
MNLCYVLSELILPKAITYSGLQKSGQGDEAADSTNSTARRGNDVLV